MHWPKPTYALTLAAPITHMVAYATEHFITTDAKWAAFVATWPMGVIWAMALAFLAGLVIQDLYNQESWLRKLWADFNGLFSVTFAGSLPAVGGGQTVDAAIQAKRRIGSAEITVSALRRTQGGFNRYVIEKRRDVHLARGEMLNLLLATIPPAKEKAPGLLSSPFDSSTMCLGKDGATFSTREEIWFEILMLSGPVFRQRFLIYFRAPFSQHQLAIMSGMVLRENASFFREVRDSRA